MTDPYLLFTLWLLLLTPPCSSDPPQTYSLHHLITFTHQPYTHSPPDTDAAADDAGNEDNDSTAAYDQQLAVLRGEATGGLPGTPLLPFSPPSCHWRSSFCILTHKFRLCTIINLYLTLVYLINPRISPLTHIYNYTNHIYTHQQGAWPVLRFTSEPIHNLINNH